MSNIAKTHSVNFYNAPYNKKMSKSGAGEKMNDNDKGKIETFVYPNMTVRVHYADISDDENERRMKKIEKSAAELLKEVIKQKGKGEGEN